MTSDGTQAPLRKYRVTKPGFATRCVAAVVLTILFAVYFARFASRDLQDQVVLGSLAAVAVMFLIRSAWTRRPTTYIRRAPTATSAVSAEQIEMLTDLHRFVDAEDAARNLLAAEPENHDGYETLARALLKQRRPTEALAAAQSALTIKPTSAHAMYLRALSMSDLHMPLRAIASLDEAIQIRPSSPQLHAAKAHQHLNIGRLGLLNRGPWPRRKHRSFSHESAQRALELDPTSAFAMGTLAAAKESLGDTDGAIVTYEQALSLDPGNARNMFALGKLVLRQRELERGATLIFAAVSLDPSLGPCASREFIPNSRVYNIAMMAWIITALLMAVWIVMALMGDVGFLRLYLAAGVLTGLRGILTWAKRASNMDYPEELQSRIVDFQDSVSGFEPAPPPTTTVERIK